MAMVPNAGEILPKNSTAGVGCTSVTDDRRTGDSIQRTANVNVGSRSLINHDKKQTLSFPRIYKNSSGDEISNVNLFTVRSGRYQNSLK